MCFKTLQYIYVSQGGKQFFYQKYCGGDPHNEQFSLNLNQRAESFSTRKVVEDISF
jgi:hypothetical protein